MLVDRKFNMTWQCVSEAQEASLILGCIKRTMAIRSRGVILPLYSILMRSYLEQSVRFWVFQHKNNTDPLDRVQGSATKTVSGLEHLFYANRLGVVIIQTGEDQSLRKKFIAALQYLKGAYKKSREGLLQEHVEIGQEVMHIAGLHIHILSSVPCNLR